MIMQHSLSILALSIITATTLVACGGSSGSSNDSNNYINITNNASNTTYTTPFIGTEYIITTTGVRNLTAEHGNVELISTANNPDLNSTANLIMTLSDPQSDNEIENPTTATWKYTLDYEKFENHELSINFIEKFYITNDLGIQKTVEQRIMPEDSLLPYAWHIYNDGDVSSRLKGKEITDKNLKDLIGFDINVLPAWHTKDKNNNEFYLTGKDVNIAILDTPLDLNHQDLKNNLYQPRGKDDFTPTFSQNLNSALTLDKFNKLDSVTHGTEVSGIIAANPKQGWSTGIAPNANLFSVAFLNVINGIITTTSFDEIYNGLLNIKANEKLDIMNMSLGTSAIGDYNEFTEFMLEALYTQNVPLIKAAGNDYYHITELPLLAELVIPKSDNNVNAYYTCLMAGSDCVFNQTDNESIAPISIVVGAVNSRGVRSSYSSTGPQLWISGFGGEFGQPEHAQENRKLPAIVSTYTSFSCDKINNTSKNKDQDNGNYWRTNIEKTCAYTARMNGTSAATPSVTGVVALLKQANPGLTISQIKYILAKSARNDQDLESIKYEAQKANIEKVDGYKTKLKTISSIVKNETTDDVSKTQITMDEGWKTNSAGFRYSNQYGFGVIDASAAVKLAMSCNTDESCQKRQNTPSDLIGTLTNTSIITNANGNYYAFEISNLQKVNNDLSLEEISEANTIEIEHVLVDVSDLAFEHDNNKNNYQKGDFCYYDNTKNTNIYGYNLGDINFNYYAQTRLEMSLTSPHNTLSIIKPYLAFWMYDKNLFSSEVVTPKQYIQTNFFYQEKVKPTDKWMFVIKSKCPIVIDDRINYTIKLKAYLNNKD